MIRLHPAIEAEALEGGLDLTATLAGGRMVRRDGLLARPAILVLAMAERCPPAWPRASRNASTAGDTR